ncbi:MAG: Na+/H+ antiporter NhaC family protein, partial [Planctomycetes bacterium]|nr:Na+/H+ antiporter NhaC family protein [Planctomycetota bacterium]
AWTGPGEWLRTRLAHARSDEALLGAAIAAFVVALVLSRRQRLLSWRELLQTSLAATRSLGLAFGILFLAWSLGHLCSDLGTGFYLTAAARSSMHAALLPPLLFVLSGAIAFATGTSFGTMAILLPNVVLLAHQLGTDSGFGGTALMLLAIGAVLEGAIFGDHCSPISDTTVLSCLGCQCDLLAHVTTQLPYALLVMATSLACGYLPAVLFGPQHWPWYLLLGGTVLALVLLHFGRDAGRARPDADRLRI